MEPDAKNVGGAAAGREGGWAGHRTVKIVGGGQSGDDMVLRGVRVRRGRRHTAGGASWHRFASLSGSRKRA